VGSGTGAATVGSMLVVVWGVGTTEVVVEEVFRVRGRRWLA
jgi:hypothetical protein